MDEEASESPSEDVSNAPAVHRERRGSSSSSEDADVDASGTFTAGGATQNDGDGVDSAQMVKKLVRLALACEYARQPIRRVDIGVKGDTCPGKSSEAHELIWLVVLGTNGRKFKVVFDRAQATLRETFGMEMVELPVREKVTISQRRGEQTYNRYPPKLS